MRTNKTSITIDGDKFNFYFQKSGGNKGAGITGEKDDKHYQSGMLMTAGSDEKYQIIKPIMSGTTLTGYTKYDDVAILQLELVQSSRLSLLPIVILRILVSIRRLKMWQSYMFLQLQLETILLINTSGKVIDNKGKSKDGNDYYYVVNNKKVVAIYLEN